MRIATRVISIIWAIGNFVGLLLYIILALLTKQIYNDAELMQQCYKTVLEYLPELTAAEFDYYVSVLSWAFWIAVGIAGVAFIMLIVLAATTAKPIQKANRGLAIFSAVIVLLTAGLIPGIVGLVWSCRKKDPDPNEEAPKVVAAETEEAKPSEE